MSHAGALATHGFSRFLNCGVIHKQALDCWEAERSPSQIVEPLQRSQSRTDIECMNAT